MDMSQLFGGMAGLGILITLCTLVPFIAVAGFFFYNSRKTSAESKASQMWPSVMGTIAASSVETSHYTNSHGVSSTSYYPSVTYEYDVRGDHYRGDRIAFGFRVGSGSRSQAQAVADRYVAGNAIRVYYNSNNPGEAVLERTSQSGNIAKWVAIALIAILCITIVPIVLGLGGMFVFMDQFFKSLPIK